jgi:hypothetical protein
MMIETVVPTWTHSNQRFFGSTALLALIEYYGRPAGDSTAWTCSAPSANSLQSKSQQNMEPPGRGLLRRNELKMAYSSPPL